MVRRSVTGCFLVSLVAGAVVGCSASDSETAIDSLSSTTPIIGGTTAAAYKEGALIAFSKHGLDYLCSGAIIAPKVVLTAGHCVDGASNFAVTAPYANGDKDATGKKGITYDWDEGDSETVNPDHHDIGLIFLDTAISLTEYPVLATKPIPDNTKIVNIGRILNGQPSYSGLYVSKPIAVRSAKADGFPFDYISDEIIESGDSGGPDELIGVSPHQIVAVNSGAGGGTQVLARVDLLAGWIKDQIKLHGGGGEPPAPPPVDPPVTPPANPECPDLNNHSFGHAAALVDHACGNLGPTAPQSWYMWSIRAANPYSLVVNSSGDAVLQMWKVASNAYIRVNNTSTTEISHTAIGPTNYMVVVFSPKAKAQKFNLRLSM